jgi:hypothetical protein
MTAGAVEAIADIGSGIFLRVDDNLIAKPDLFTKLTARNGFQGWRSEFYCRIAGLVSHSGVFGFDLGTLAGTTHEHSQPKNCRQQPHHARPWCQDHATNTNESPFTLLGKSND